LGSSCGRGIARLVRGQALAVRETVFVEAARAVGGSHAWIIQRHVSPSILPVIAAQFAVSVSVAIFTSASLSFLGLGIPPPAADWGGMVRAGYDYLAINPAMSLGPGVAVTLTVMGFYMLEASFK
jgi:peptide/nickel transport system permease protein